ncbi:kinase-like protein [Rhizoclosmatium globosum]|uniref:non-specific serine/threonine protein kinase n=1 Tax=Rhizoclosmatium globosum TaxID=329046 RepID=A0A1Y2CII1_9FUNG|nr:kinase-like protein [Rhizoclosmatium globosum]|eukprot:ORY46634.1 kinase-like protein [Rhizoclosmatium globosum]
MDPNPLPFIEITVSDVSLGSGSFGTVFAGEYGSAQAFQEARIWYKLRHPNIASLYGISKSNDGYPCLVIERFQRTLHNRLMSDPKNVPTLQERIKWLLDISCAYEYLHSCNPPVYHRDLKPDNILLDEHGKAVLTDFGLSTVQSMSSRQRKPRVGHYLYAPPESLVLDYVVTSAYDVYSFGMTAYEVLTRHRPFLGQVQESDPYIVMSWICDGKRPPRCGTKGYRPQADSISDEVWQLINACWEQSPILRPNFSSITSTLKKLSKDLGK